MFGRDLQRNVEAVEYKREKERGRIEAEIKEGVDVGKRKRKRSNI